MKNKTLALFGICTLILAPLAALLPVPLMVISILTIPAYTVLTIIRLWKYSKGLAVLFAFISIILGLMYFVYSQYPGSTFHLLWNIAQVIYPIIFIWTIYFLWKKAKSPSDV
jgi:hypothetical protein